MLTRGLIVANGIAWSPDGGTMYFSDSHASVVLAYAWNAEDGTIGHRRIFSVLTPEQGRPDGAATDEHENYWSAGVSKGRLNCFTPDGRCVGSIVLPVQAPTVPAFAGADASTLFVTSHRRVPEPQDDDGPSS